MKNHWVWLSSFFFILSLHSPRLALAQQAVGVVTALKGKAQLTRAAAQTALRFKDNLVLRDVIDTQERSLARILFGGKSTVTVRELSRLEVREEILPTGATRSIHELSSGGILVNVVRRLLGPRDEVQIRTPNAIAAVRGSSGVCDYNPKTGITKITNLGGGVDVAVSGQPLRKLPPGHSISVLPDPVTGASKLGNPVPLTKAESDETQKEFDTGLAVEDEGNREELAEEGAEEGGQLLKALERAAIGISPVEPVINTGPKIDENEPPAPITVDPEAAKADLPHTFESDTFGADPFISFSGSIDEDVNLIQVDSGIEAILTRGTEDGKGRLLDVSSELTGRRLLSVRGILTGEAKDDPFIKIKDGEVITEFGFTGVVEGGEFTLAGPFLDAENSTFTAGSSTRRRNFITLRDSGSLLKSTGSGFLVTLNPSTVEVRRFLDVRESAKMELTGSFLDDTGSTFTTEGDFARIAQAATLDSDSADPLFKFTNSTLNVGTDDVSSDGTSPLDNFFRVDDRSGSPAVIVGGSTVTLDGPLVKDSGSTFTIVDNFLRVRGSGSRLESTSTDAFIQLSDSTVNINNEFARIDESGKVTLSGSFLSAGSTLNISKDASQFGDLLDIRTGGQLVMKSDESVILLSGGTHTIGTDGGTTSTPNRLFNLRGSTDNLDAEGLGKDQPIIAEGTDLGSLLEAKGGAKIEVKHSEADAAGGNALRLDAALLEASKPIIKLISSSSTQTELTTAEDAMNISRSRVTSQGPVIDLDNGLIKVTDGALINLRSGSNMDVTGDLLSLTNGSRINVVNGPLIKVRGTSSTGEASFLEVSRALVVFGGTGNTIVVNNNINPTKTIDTAVGRFPVREASGGSVSIGNNPILGSAAQGTITVNGDDVRTFAGAFDGTLIEATSNGEVDIKAP